METRGGVWDGHLGGNLSRLFQVSHFQASLVRFRWGGEYFYGFHALPKSTCKKKKVVLFGLGFFLGFLLPPQFGNEIGVFEQENYFPLKNVIDAANLVAKNIFL